jgi:hypothetical protein
MLPFVILAQGCFCCARPRSSPVEWTPRWVVPLDAVATEQALLENRDAIHERGGAVPVGVRGFGDDVLVIDVLLVVPAPYASPFQDDFTDSRGILTYLHTRAVYYAAVLKHGFILRHCDGMALPLVALERVPGEEFGRTYGLAPTHQLGEPFGTQVGGRSFCATLLPVMVRCAERVEVGSCIDVQLEATRAWPYPIAGRRSLTVAAGGVAAPIRAERTDE